MTDPTPDIVWPPHAARRHVQEPAPDAGPADPPTWPENAWPTPRQFVDRWAAMSDPDRLGLAERIVDAGQRASQCFVMDHESSLEHWKDRAERAESNARGKQAVIEAQRATLDRVRALLALPFGWDSAFGPVVFTNPDSGKWEPLHDALRAILDAPQPEAGGDDE